MVDGIHQLCVDIGRGLGVPGGIVLAVEDALERVGVLGEGRHGGRERCAYASKVRSEFGFR